MRFYIPAIAVLALAACDPVVPDSGVGFDGYASYEKQRAAREAMLRGQATPRQDAISGETVQSSSPPPPPQQTTPAQPPLSATSPAPLSAQSAPANTTSTANTNVGISDEQDFGAVSSRESIESDRERLERQREQYVVIEPTAVPMGNGSDNAKVVEFALSTNNRVGESLYRRSKVFAQSRFNRNCQKYPSPDMAQAAFLKSGGPRKDSKGLDPDGDGFACSWDPQPFRTARSGG
jgi:hypothetical protein